eukprot:g53417.t1
MAACDAMNDLEDKQRLSCCCLCVFLVIAFGCLIGWQANQKKNGNYIKLSGYISETWIETKTCSEDCNCRESCSGTGDSKSCHRVCDTCYYTCYGENVRFAWTCPSHKKQICSGSREVGCCYRSKNQAEQHLGEKYPVGKNLTLYVHKASSPTNPNNKWCLVALLAIFSGLWWQASSPTNPNNKVREKLFPVKSVFISAMVFLALSLPSFLYTWGYQLSECLVSIVLCRCLSSDRGQTSQRPQAEAINLAQNSEMELEIGEKKAVSEAAYMQELNEAASTLFHPSPEKNKPSETSPEGGTTTLALLIDTQSGSSSTPSATSRTIELGPSPSAPGEGSYGAQTDLLSADEVARFKAALTNGGEEASPSAANPPPTNPGLLTAEEIEHYKALARARQQNDNN